MRLAASILRFFLSILQLCGSPWLASSSYERFRLLMRAPPRLKALQTRPAMLREARVFPARYPWWPFAIGPPIGARGNEIPVLLAGSALIFL